MSHDHRVFAAELRADALALRTMAESLELRAGEQDRLAEVEDIEREAADDPRGRHLEESAFRMNMTPEACLAHFRQRRSDRRGYAEDRHDFRGIGYVGSSHAPEPVFR